MIGFISPLKLITEAVFYMKKGVLRNLTKFTGKHLCQSLVLQACAWKTASVISKLISKLAKSIVKFTGRITSGFILQAKSKFYW